MLRFKQHISLLLATAFVFGLLWQTVTIVNFYMNRQEITEKHCENKDKPELNCKGQCHLKKQLEAATPDQEEKNDNSRPTSISYLLFVFVPPTQSDWNDLELEQQRYATNYSVETSTFTSEILDPPQYT